MTLADTSVLNKITLIILSFNHPLKLERAIEHWRDLPLTVHILDGSDKPWFAVGPLPNAPNIIYSHIPRESNETPLQNYMNRARFIASLSIGKYAALIGDDDFFTTMGLISAVQHLESHSEIDAVIGKCARFDLSHTRVIWTRKYKNWSVNENSKNNSLSKRLGNDRSLGTVYYGVLRSEKLKQIQFRANEFKFSNQKYNEIITHVLGMGYCRVELLDTYLWLRNGEVGRSKDNDQGSFLGTLDEDEKVIYVFEKAFKDIDNSIAPEIIRELAANETNKLKNLLLENAKKHQDTSVKSLRKKIEIFIKKLIVKSVSNSPQFVIQVIIKALNHKNKLKLQDALPLDFEEKEYFERLLLRPRSELRLFADVE